MKAPATTHKLTAGGLRAPLAVIAVYLVAAAGVWLGWWGTDWSGIQASGRQPPSPEHWLGTNLLGQDIFSRLLAGTATAFEVGLLVSVPATLLGALVGAFAGYFPQRWPDAVLMWLTGTLDAIPFYLFVIALSYAMRDHPAAMQLAMIMTFWTLTARIVRAETLRIRQLGFVAAARVSGLGSWQIIRRHVVPHTVHILLVQAAILFVAAIKAEVLLSFLGLGLQDGVSWGIMLAEASQEILAGHYGNFVAASAALLLLVLAINRMTDELQRSADPRSRGSADPAARHEATRA
ncbi:MAG: ABC transporter permease subunit [Gammaproteobacteria bacterium]|jgi:peptide/nickel transport system permease protein|nr:ABC transporter permease subunit [Gammaproteobacteria bacterium]